MVGARQRPLYGQISFKILTDWGGSMAPCPPPGYAHEYFPHADTAKEALDVDTNSGIIDWGKSNLSKDAESWGESPYFGILRVLY